MRAPRVFWIKAKLGDQKALRICARLADMLSRNDVELFFDPILARELKMTGRGLGEAELKGKVDMLIVVGGDGTLLRVVHLIPGEVPPLLGINSDTIGFLYDFGGEDAEKVVGEVLEGRYTLEYRRMGRAVIELPDEEITQRFLNEALVANRELCKLLKFDLLIDGELVYRGRADGLIVSTTTGASAYALSAGGPVVDPRLECIVAVPLAPFSPLMRPMVLDPGREIAIKVWHEGVMVTDGLVRVPLPIHSMIHVSVGDFGIPFVKVGEGRRLYHRIINRLLDKPWSYSYDMG